jgi:hypothetical protein
VTGRPGRLLRLLTLSAAILVIASAPADAARKPVKLRQVTATASAVGSFNVASATARCPARTKAVGGGYTTSVPSIPSHWLNVYESRRLNDREWRVSGVEYFPAPATDTLAAYVYCQTFTADIKAATASVQLPLVSHSFNSVLARCPSRHRVVSGGFLAPQPSSATASYVSRSTPVKQTGWVVDATNLLAAPNVVSSWAYCAKVPKPRQLSEDIAVLGPAGSAKTVATPACPRKTLPVGGGFATSIPVGGLAATALVYETKRAGRSWSASASASGNSTSSTLVSTALCR